MVPRRQDYGMKRAGGARSGSVMGFRTTVSSGSVHRSSAVLPSVLTFLVIVASGGLLLMIEKGMLNSMDTPPPRGSSRRLDFIRQPGKHGSAVDVDSQVRVGGRMSHGGCACPRGYQARCSLHCFFVLPPTSARKFHNTVSGDWIKGCEAISSSD